MSLTHPPAGSCLESGLPPKQQTSSRAARCQTMNEGERRASGGVGERGLMGRKGLEQKNEGSKLGKVHNVVWPGNVLAQAWLKGRFPFLLTGD